MLIGIDAGGSRTTAAVADAGGRMLARAEAGPGAVRPGQAAIAASAIFSSARDALQRARQRAPAAAMVVGASGAGSPAGHNALAAALEGCGLASRLLVTTDAEIALEAAFGDAPGIVLIAGTGSVGWARLPGGITARAGGLGPVLGDRGSGYDIGREALRAIGASIEFGIELELTGRVLAHLGIERADLVGWSLAAGVPQVASLAPVVLDAAASGDEVARTLALQAARHIAGLASLLAQRFDKSTPPAIAWSGGLLASRADYRTMVMDCVREDVPGAMIATAPVDAVAGAIAIAKKLGE